MFSYTQTDPLHKHTNFLIRPPLRAVLSRMSCVYSVGREEIIVCVLSPVSLLHEQLPIRHPLKSRALMNALSPWVRNRCCTPCSFNLILPFLILPIPITSQSPPPQSRFVWRRPA